MLTPQPIGATHTKPGSGIYFKSYQEVILAAKELKVTVFVMDAPPCLYYLHKFSMQDLYRQTAPLNVGYFHRAVKKGDGELLKLVDDEFKKISPSELLRIEAKWFGASLGEDPFLMRYSSEIAGSLALVLLILFVWNRVLRQRVEERTAELKTSLLSMQTLSLRQEAILSAIPDIIMEVDTHKVYTWANSVGLEFFGGDVLGKAAAHYFEGSQDTDQLFQSLFDGKAKVVYIESWQRRKDGEIRLLAWWCKELKNEQGKIIGAISTARDVTERLRIEAELQKMQKLTSVGTLAGGIAHDFNNILMGIFGYIALAKNEFVKEQPGFKALEDAEKSMGRAIRLSKQLLTFSKGGDPVKEAVSLGPVVEDVAQFDLSGSTVMLRVKAESDLWVVKADKGQIQQVISNLVINARQAMPNGGGLIIVLENVNVPLNAIPGLPQGKYVKITMKDEGVGMAQETVSRIFDPYFTTKQSGQGLGLATAYSIISKHGGHIGVASAPGKGTTFTVHLPACDSLIPLKAQGPSDKLTPMKRSAKILVLDDEVAICEFISRWLGRNGCVVKTTLEGHEALEMYKQSFDAGDPFDVVILDLTIPGGMGGQEVIKGLLVINPRVKAIVSSGFAEGPILANHDSYGFKGVIAKPYTERQLLDVIERVLGEDVT